MNECYVSTRSAHVWTLHTTYKHTGTQAHEDTGIHTRTHTKRCTDTNTLTLARQPTFRDYVTKHAKIIVHGLTLMPAVPSEGSTVTSQSKARTAVVAATTRRSSVAPITVGENGVRFISSSVCWRRGSEGLLCQVLFTSRKLGRVLYSPCHH